VSFYGWNRVDSFFSAWKGAGFTPVGCLQTHRLTCHGAIPATTTIQTEKAVDTLKPIFEAFTKAGDVILAREFWQQPRRRRSSPSAVHRHRA
jgi:hypothetical protein